MRKGRWYCTFLLLLGAVLSGCVTYQWRSDPPRQQVSNDCFTADLLVALDSYGCRSFLLSLQNKTEKNIEIDWNKTLYITHGQTSGGFMFEGVVYLNRNNPKPPDIIFAHSSFAKTIWPCNLVDFSSGRYSGGWFHRPMPEGENGVYLSVMVDGKEVTERLTVNLTATRIQ